MSFAHTLRDLRTEKNISQKKLGEIFNVADNTITSWEKGRTEPSYSILINLADYFDVSLDYLCGRTSDITFRDEYQNRQGLSSEEQELVTKFQNLLSYEKAQAIGYITALAESRNSKRKLGEQ